MKFREEEKEREAEFYFNKLRVIEALCDENEGDEFARKIQAILYATQVSKINQLYSW